MRKSVARGPLAQVVSWDFPFYLAGGRGTQHRRQLYLRTPPPAALDCRIEIASRLYRQAPLKLDVLGFKVLQMRRDGMQCCALGNVDQLRAIILHVLVSHNFVAASEQ